MLIAGSLFGCPHRAPPVAVPLPPETPQVSVCDAVTAWRAYVAAHPDMAEWADPLAFATWPYAGWDGCALPELDPPLTLRLGGPRAEEPCPGGTEPMSRPGDEGTVYGCVGGAPVGDGAFAVDDRGRVLEGWSVEEVGEVVVAQAQFAAGRQLSELEWGWTDGRPVLTRWRTFRADGHAESDTWFDEHGVVAGYAHYRPVYDEDRRVTWVENGPTTAVRIAETEEDGTPRVVREWSLVDGVAGPVERWVSESETLSRAAEFRAHARPVGAPVARCPDPAVVGRLHWVTRYSRATVELPAGVRRVKVPPGWAVEPDGEAGHAELLVVQEHAWNYGRAPFDPCSPWTDSGVRVERVGPDLQLTVFGIGETALELSAVRGVVLVPPGVTGKADPKLYAASEQAAAGPGLALTPDPGRAAEVYGPLLAQESPVTFRQNTGRVLFPLQSTEPAGDIGLHPFQVDTDRKDTADTLLTGLRAAAPALEACFAPVLKAVPDADGTVSLYFSVRPDGTVGYARVLGGFLQMLNWDERAKPFVPGVLACLDARVRALELPSPGTREVVVQAELSTPNLRSQLGVVRP